MNQTGRDASDGSTMLRTTAIILAALTSFACYMETEDEIDDGIILDRVRGDLDSRLDAETGSEWCDEVEGSIGCPCPKDAPCVVGLECRSGYCGPYPAEQLGCDCGPLGTCEGDLTCVDSTCVY